MPITTLHAPWGYKWVITYKQDNGKQGMSVCDTHFSLPHLISALLLQSARDIVITDETHYKD